MEQEQVEEIEEKGFIVGSARTRTLPSFARPKAQVAFHQLFIFAKSAFHCGLVYPHGKEMLR
jgi:hypothetical protein